MINKKTRKQEIDNTINFYNENSKEYNENTINIEMKDVYDEFLKSIPNKGSILDCGCGSGRDSVYFQDKNYLVTSFDASEELVNLAKKNNVKNVTKETFDSFYTNKKYDGIFFMASLLHLNPEEFNKTLLKFKKYLKQNGTMYISLKEGNNEGKIINGRYFYYWKEETVNNIFKKLNLKNKIFKTKDLKVNERQKEKWLNCIINNDNLYLQNDLLFM